MFREGLWIQTRSESWWEEDNHEEVQQGVEGDNDEGEDSQGDRGDRGEGDGKVGWVNWGGVGINDKIFCHFKEFRGILCN